MGQFRALAIKNWIIYRRNKIGSILQIILPIAFLCFTILTRNLAEIVTYEPKSLLSNNSLFFYTYGDPINAVQSLNVGFPALIKGCNPNQKVALVPTGDPMVIKLQTILQSMNYIIQQYDNDTIVDNIIKDVGYNITLPAFCFGVTFTNSGNNYKYKLRFNVSNYQFPSPQLKITLDQKINLGYYYQALGSGAMSLTNIINTLILQKQTGSTSSMFYNKMGIIYQEKYIYDPMYMYMGNSFQFINLLPLLIIYLRQTSFMLQEKQKKIRESMLITGMSLWVYYATWFLRYFIIYLLVHVANSFIITFCFPHVPYYIPFTVYLIFDIVLIIQSFFIQIFITRAKIGIIFALLFFILQYAISYAISSNSNVTEQIYNYMSIVPHIAYKLAFKNIIYGDSKQLSITFTSTLDSYKIITAVISLICNAVFWAISAWYLDQVFPNEWGAKKGICFCLQSKRSQQYKQQQNNDWNNQDLKQSKQKIKKTIFPQGDSSMIQSLSTLKIKKQHKNPNFQQVDAKFKLMEERNKAIIIRDLHKQFDDFHAVQGLNFSIYSDQIFVLLGHNGAGKTTLISMLTGMIQPTSGVIQVMGQTGLTQIRTKLGVCPQHDTLYDELTVEEHLKLYGTFRGLSGDQLDIQTDKLIKDVNLEQKRDQYSKNLSGGQKRRLSVAIAFSGGAKVIILDQPTSGMDTSARRYIWEMIKNYKSGRIILLTTHFMDQADYLGDRIAIMAKGKLEALGSNMFLKNKFGVGYNITFVKLHNAVKSSLILDAVKKYISEATILTNVSSQFSIQLPLQKVKYFSKLFNQIDGRKKQLGIQSYGIGITTLQQVFLKVGSKDQQQEKVKKKITNSKRLKSEQLQKIQISEPRSPQKLKKKSKSKQLTIQEQFSQMQTWQRQDQCCQRFCSHLTATILKRFRVVRRDLKSFVFQLILPMAIITLAMFLMRISFIRDYSSMDIGYNIYLQQSNPVDIPIGSNTSGSTQLDNLGSQINSKYGNQYNVLKYIASNDILFDQQFLYPLKLSNQKLRGGIYYQPAYTMNGTTIYPMTTIMNTRTPTSSISVQTLAAQTMINYLSSNSISITPVNSPFPMTQQQLQVNNTISGLFGALIFSIALAFKFTSVVSFVVKERQDNCKHQQIVSGLNIGSYWIGTYFYDLLLYFIVAGFSIGMCKALQISMLIDNGAYLATCLLFAFFGVSNITLTYIFANLFKDYGNAQGAIYFFNFVGGGIAPIIIMVLRWISEDSNKIGRGLAWFLRIIPSFAFGQGLLNISSMKVLVTYENDGNQYKPMDLQIALAPIIYLIGTTCIFTFFIFFLECLQNNQDVMRTITSESKYEQTNPVDQQDVLRQQKISLKANPNQFQILTKKLRKVYILDSDKKYKVAVDNLSFGVKKGEVFGLLGINGAGKSTTFKMLAGQIVSTSGQCYFMGLKIYQNLAEIRKNLGYCPQFDALIQNLTVRQQLQLYYDLKCLPSRFKKIAIDLMIKQLDLIPHQFKLSGTLSGGNKRKLSVAMAMIGNPSIIFLDEPSTGMDPKARRFMWKVISKIATQKKQSTIILTTHAMEQAQALSSRLSIMVNGNFKCIGTPQHIKSKYGKGFQIQIKVKAVQQQQIRKHLINLKLKTTKIVKQNLQQFLQSINVSIQTINQFSSIGRAKHIWAQLEAEDSIPARIIVQFCLLQEKLLKLQKMLAKAFGKIQVIENFETYIRYKTLPQISVGKLFQYLQLLKSEDMIIQYAIKQSTVQQIFNQFAENLNKQEDV